MVDGESLAVVRLIGLGNWVAQQVMGLAEQVETGGDIARSPRQCTIVAG